MLTNSATPLQKAEEQIRMPESVQKLITGAQNLKKRKLFKATNLLPIQRKSDLVKKNKMTLAKFSKLLKSNNKDSFKKNCNLNGEICIPSLKDVLENSTSALQLEHQDIHDSPLKPEISLESQRNLERAVTQKDSFSVVPVIDNSVLTDYNESENFETRSLSNDINNDHCKNEGIANENAPEGHKNIDVQEEYLNDQIEHNPRFENSIVDSATWMDRSDNQDENYLLAVENKDENFLKDNNSLAEKVITCIKSSMKTNGSNVPSRKKWVTFNDILESQRKHSLVDGLHEKIENQLSNEEKTRTVEIDEYDGNSYSMKESTNTTDCVVKEPVINADQIGKVQILEMIACVQQMNEMLLQVQNEIFECNIPQEEESVNIGPLSFAYKGTIFMAGNQYVYSGDAHATSGKLLLTLEFWGENDVPVSFEETIANGSHLITGNYRRCSRNVPIYKNFVPLRVSSPKPKKESKYNFKYFSDSEHCKMPSDFENSSMKNCFSMSSLQPSSRVCLEQSLQATLTPSPVLPNRAYNSLTHKLRKRTPEQVAWRNSWGLDDHKDEFWSSFESNYRYLMNNNLIDSCKEAKNDLYPSSSQDWTYSHFKQQFLELNSWLNSIQKTIYTNEDNMTVSIRLNQIEEMKHRNYQRKNFVNQSSRLVTRFPEHKDEILDYVSQLNTKWDRLAQTVSPKNTMSVNCFSRRKDLLCELRCLGKWIHAVENKLEPVNFRKKWTLDQLRQKAREHEAIQKDVDSHRKPVVSVVKLCENFSQNTNNSSTSYSRTSNGSETEVKRNSVLKRAKRLEERWQHLYLKCLEWQCFIENRISTLQTESSNDAGTDSDDEKSVFKHRRLNSTAQKCLFPAKVKKDDCVDIMDVEESMIRSISDPMRISRSNIDYDDVKKLDSECSASTPTNSPSVVQLNDNFNSLKLCKMSDDPIPIEFALFNRTVNSARNIAVHYCRHEDTDLEQETTTTMDKVVARNSKTSDDSSSGEDDDDEWTYRNAANDSMETGASSSANDETLNETRNDDTMITATTTTTETDHGDGGNNLSKRVPPKFIRRLVDGAEELVNAVKKSQTKRKCDGAVGVSKMKGRQNEQVVDWLRKCRSNDDCSEVNSIGDSYDAGSEDTTEEDDQFERRSSCDQTMTMIGSSRDNGIDTSPTISSEEPKVILRPKNGSSKKSRPYSTPAVRYWSSDNLTPVQWSSETALSLTKMPTTLKDARGGTLSSSTMDECAGHTLDGSGYSMNSLRRRKVKCRRKSTTGRKGHSGSVDSFSSLNGHEIAGGSRGTHLSPTRSSRDVNQSETLSEPITRSRFSTSGERTIASDPANCVYNATTTTTSGTETEEELSNSRKCLARKKLSQLPAFRLGPQHGAVTCRDNAVAVSVTSNEEQLSSFSEHAWDDYQEKYVSEAYSEEPVDPDQVKQVTEFGEDYHNYIDSLSDCASSFTKRSCTIYGHSTLIAEDESSPLDSDSDLGDVRSFLQRGHTQLCNTEQLFAKQIAKPSSCYLLSESDFSKIRNTCRENIRCLRVMLDRIEKDVPSYKPLKLDVKSMLEKWECLEDKTDSIEINCSIQRNILELRKELLDVSSSIFGKVFQFKDRVDLERNILLLKRDIDNLMEKKVLISDYNFKTHRLLKDSKYSPPSLNDDINELYRIWEDAHQKIEDQLIILQKASMSWRQFDVHMDELKTVLRQNHDNLNELDRALRRDECVVEDVVSSVKNIDKYLPDKQHNNLIKLNNNLATLTADQVENNVFTFMTSALNVEGSLSDSGISDSGSEHDSYERRLTLLKKLARHLESVLTPGSEALLSIMRKIDETEEEIKELQQTCRTIFNSSCLDKENRREKLAQEGNIEEENIIAIKTNPGDPEPDPGKGKSFFWRVLRASVPFHVAFVVLLCVACFLEPNCCDTINNLHLSFAPQLRYRSGPPPT